MRSNISIDASVTLNTLLRQLNFYVNSNTFEAIKQNIVHIKPLAKAITLK